MSQNHINKIIAVASGKGGVGKSTVAINLAASLAKKGAKVGLLDADIYGPSQPAMLGVAKGTRPEVKEGRLQPIERHGVKSMSIGYLVKEEEPIVWRGPMIGKAMQQLLQDTDWGQLDYLVIDLPPGTGDVQLTLCQKINLNGAVIVTTPQDMALHDVRRACAMFAKMNVPILGVIENMSHFHCPQCGHDAKLFGEGGAAEIAKEFDLTCLAQLPLALDVRQSGDAGQPIAVSDHELALAFAEAAEQIEGLLAKQKKDYSKIFPKVVVEHQAKDKG